MLALKKKTLKCSFCGKTEKEVSRLVGGPGVYICDGCIGTCNKILEATPSTFAGWDKMTDEQLLDGLKTAEATVEATRAVLQTHDRGAEAAQCELGGHRQVARHLAAGRMGALFIAAIAPLSAHRHSRSGFVRKRTFQPTAPRKSVQRQGPDHLA